MEPCGSDGKMQEMGHVCAWNGPVGQDDAGAWELDYDKAEQTLVSCNCAACAEWLELIGRPNRNADGSATYECTMSSCADYNTLSGTGGLVATGKTACEGIAPIDRGTLRGATGPADGSLGREGFCQPQCMPPTFAPTKLPTLDPTIPPSSAPSADPSTVPTVVPSMTPTAIPSHGPTTSPSMQPTLLPTGRPTFVPSVPCPVLTGRRRCPISVPVTTISPTIDHSLAPSLLPSHDPTSTPSFSPSSQPSLTPTIDPTDLPSAIPTLEPSIGASAVPTLQPTSEPSELPTGSCKVGQWQPWACTATCGGGTSSRSREILRAAPTAVCPELSEVETDPLDESCLVSSCDELICDPPTCCVCGTKMPSDLRNGTVRSKDRLFVYRETALPVTLVDGAAVSLTEPGVYNEVANTTWSSQATMSTLPAGTKVLSYFVHVDSEGETSSCKMRFNTEVLGFQGMVLRASQDAMDASHALFSPGTRFCTRAGSGGCARAMENANDGVTLGSDRMEVSVTSRSLRGLVDQLRVLVKPKELPPLVDACPKPCGMSACPVDCLVDIWQAWGPCSVSCGSGTRQRSRWVLDAGQDGASCPGLTEEGPCYSGVDCAPDATPFPTAVPTAEPTTPIPTALPSADPTTAFPTASPSCGFIDWGEWGDCSVTCGGGSRQRTRAGSAPGCPSETETETDPLDESCLVSSCDELICDPPTCCVCGTKMPSDLRNGTVRSKDRLFVYRETALPVTLVDGAAVSLTELGVYNEVANTTWSSQATMSTLPAGTKVLSYFVHVDSEGETSSCKMRFNTEVLGFQGMVLRASQDAMDASHALFSPGTRFCTRAGSGGCARAMENVNDGVTLGSDRMEVSVTSRSLRGLVDQLRVLVKPKELPVGLTACPKGCGKAACPVDCLVDIWQAWGACPQTCGFSTRQRSRWVLDAGQGNGTACPELTELGPCFQIDCAPDATAVPTDVATDAPTAEPTSTPSSEPSAVPISTPAPECGLEEWGDWGDCSVTCGGGSRQRTRAGSAPGCPSENQTETDPLDESCLVSSCDELICDPPTCCVCGTKMPSDLRNGTVRSKDRLFVYRETALPVTLVDGAAVSLTEPGVYNEVANATWSSQATMSTLPAGTKVLSYFVHVDSEGETSSCKMRFNTEVLGFQGMVLRASQDAMDASHALFSPGTRFCTRAGSGGCARAMENVDDGVTLGSDRMEVSVTSRSLRGLVDQLRVLVKPKELPVGLTACPKGCGKAACPVDCLVDIWQAWGPCSVSCGSGTRQRSRWVLDAGQDGVACPELTEDEKCEKDLCFSVSSEQPTAVPSTPSPSVTPSIEPTAAPSVSGCVTDWTELDFSAEKLTVNNLGGAGPGSGADEMRFSSAGKGKGGSAVDLVVTATGAYTPGQPSLNRVSEKVANINVKVGSSVNLRFRFVDQTSGAEVVLAAVFVSFFDIDHNPGFKEMLTVHGFDRYFLRTDADETLPNLQGTSAIEVVSENGTTTFTSKQDGFESDNPTDPTQLNTQQQQRVVSFLFVGKSGFDATFELAGSKLDDERNLLFAGISSVVTDLCPTQAPTTPPPSYAPLNADCAKEYTKLKFSADKLTINNLGGMGPGSGAEEMRFAGIGNVWQESAEGTDLAPGEWDGSGDTTFSQCRAKAESSVHSVHAFAVASLARSEQCTLGMRIMHSCRV